MKAKKGFFIEYSSKDNFEEIFHEDFKTRDEVFARHLELTGTQQMLEKFYIHKWQVGQPFPDNEHFYNA